MLNSWTITILLGAIQGLTEFLPVSSSGHLVIFEYLLNRYSSVPVDEPVRVNIVLHAGTLGSVVVIYFRQILRLLGDDRRVLGLLLVATIPAVVVGLPIRMFAKHWLESAGLTGAMLLVTAAVLFSVTRRGDGQTNYVEMTWWQALLIGLAQAVAVLPGLSRSGATIAAGLLVGLKREQAATFAFLMAIPVIAGACVLELKEALTTSSTVPWGPLTAGFVVAFVVGLAALAWVIHWLRRGWLHWFAWWCLALGLAVLGIGAATPGAATP